MKPLLLCIDVQLGFEDPIWGARNNPDAECHIARLLQTWRVRNWPVAHVQHASNEPNSPLRKDRPGFAFKEASRPVAGEPIFEKSVNSAFIGTSLEHYLRDTNQHALVVVGLTTDHCVSTSTRMGANLGFGMSVVADATATFDRFAEDGTRLLADSVHTYALASLNGEFARIVHSHELMSLS